MLLDAEKCRYGIETANTLGSSVVGGAAMSFGAVATDTMSPPRNYRVVCGTPKYLSPSGQSKFRILNQREIFFL